MACQSRVPPQGRQNPSPLKRRNDKKSSTQVNSALQDIRRKAVFAHLARLVNPPTPAPNDNDTNTSDAPEHVSSPVDLPPGKPMEVMVDEEVVEIPENSRRTQPDQEAFRLYARWKEVLPTLHGPYLHFLNHTVGHPTPPLAELVTHCQNTSCTHTSTSVLCLLWDCKSTTCSFLHWLCIFRLHQKTGYLLQLPDTTASAHRTWTVPNSTSLPTHGDLHYAPWLLQRPLQMLLWCYQCNGICTGYVLWALRFSGPKWEGKPLSWSLTSLTCSRVYQYVICFIVG